MPDFNQWLSRRLQADQSHRAMAAWRRIQRQPTPITIQRDGTPLAPQTVRLEASENLRSGASPTTTATFRGVVVFGVRGHPQQADSDLLPGDRFAVGAVLYQVLDVMLVAGELQARAVQVS